MGLCSCQNGTKIQEDYQKRDSNILPSWHLVQGIDADSLPLHHGFTKLQVINDYLLVIDYQTKDYFIHILKLDDFSFVKSILPKGHGKGEIVQINGTFTDSPNHTFYVQDLGRRVFKLNIDSVINCENYQPICIHNWGNNPKIHALECSMVQYPLTIANTMEPTGASGFNQSIVSYNLESGEICKFDYNHPKATTKRIEVIASKDYNVCAALYHNRDLITLYDLDGNVLKNIYGPDWKNDDDAHGLYYFASAVMAEDRIFALHAGTDYNNDSAPQKIIVFDLYGNYLKTMDMESHRLGTSICYDCKYKRIFFSTDEHEIAYIQLEKL